MSKKEKCSRCKQKKMIYAGSKNKYKCINCQFEQQIIKDDNYSIFPMLNYKIK